MSDTFITSDEHLGHDNHNGGIIAMCGRPFASLEEMMETFIERHNKKVPNKWSYTTIHTGDLFWRTLPRLTAQSYLRRLHGKHAYVWGNHEELFSLYPELCHEFLWMKDVHQLHFDKHKLWISHYAHRVWPSSHKGSWHVFGHSHNELPRLSEKFGDLGLSFDIGVDGHNYEPWSLEEIAAKMETLKSHHFYSPKEADV